MFVGLAARLVGLEGRGHGDKETASDSELVALP